MWVHTFLYLQFADVSLYIIAYINPQLCKLWLQSINVIRAYTIDFYFALSHFYLIISVTWNEKNEDNTSSFPIEVMVVTSRRKSMYCLYLMLQPNTSNLRTYQQTASWRLMTQSIRNISVLQTQLSLSLSLPLSLSLSLSLYIYIYNPKQI